MKNKSQYHADIRTKTAVGAIAGMTIVIAAASGCATQQAPEIRGRWIPVNSFAEKTEAIPLRRSYSFYPSPTDKTLKTMLSRWAQDSNLTLRYLHPDDFTLHVPVTRVRTGNLQDAVSSLTKIYAEQQISITANEKEIVVEAKEAPQNSQVEQKK